MDNKSNIIFDPIKPIENVEFDTIELEKIEPKRINLFNNTKTVLNSKQKRARAKAKRAKQARKKQRK